MRALDKLDALVSDWSPEFPLQNARLELFVTYLANLGFARASVSYTFAALGTFSEMLGYPRPAFKYIHRLISGIPADVANREMEIKAFPIGLIYESVFAALPSFSAEPVYRQRRWIAAALLLCWPARPHTLAGIVTDRIEFRDNNEISFFSDAWKVSPLSQSVLLRVPDLLYRRLYVFVASNDTVPYLFSYSDSTTNE